MSSPIDERGSSPLPKFDDTAPGKSPKAISSLGKNLRFARRSAFVRIGIKVTEKMAYKIPGVKATTSLVEGTRAFEVIKTSAKTTSAVLAPVTKALGWGVVTEQLYSQVQELKKVTAQMDEKREIAGSDEALLDSKSYAQLQKKEDRLKVEIQKTMAHMGCKALKVSALIGLPFTSAAGLGLFLAEEMIDRKKIGMVNRWVIQPVGDSVSRLMTDRTVQSAVSAAKATTARMSATDFAALPEKEVREIASAHLDALYTLRFGMSKKEFETEKKNLEIEIINVKRTTSLSPLEKKQRIQKLRADFHDKIVAHRMNLGQRVPGEDYLLYRFQEVARNAYSKARRSGADVEQAQQKAKEAALRFEGSLSEEERGILRKERSDEFSQIGSDIHTIESILKYSLSPGKEDTRRKKRLFRVLEAAKTDHLERVEKAIEEKSGYSRIAKGASWCWDTASSLVRGAYELVTPQYSDQGCDLVGKVHGGPRDRD